jgi:hypothetical protein
VRSRFQPKSALGRAVLPVAAGLGFFALLGLATWGIAALLSRNPDQVNERLARTTFEVGNTERVAEIISTGGPLLFQGLVGDDADDSVVLDHTGESVNTGWVIYYAYPSDRDDTCKVKQIVGTRQFTDCDGRTLDVEQLAAPPLGVSPLVGDTIILDLRPDG